MLKTAFILFLLLASGCKDQYTPKPYGYFRIDFPEKQWVASPDTLPYCFEQSAQAILEADPDKQAELEEQIFRKENQLEGLADMRWSISQESIDCYRSVAKNMKIAYESPFFGSGEGGGMQAVNDVIAKFCEDGLVESEVDGLISELDRVTFMVSMEGR